MFFKQRKKTIEILAAENDVLRSLIKEHTTTVSRKLNVIEELLLIEFSSIYKLQKSIMTTLEILQKQVAEMKDSVAKETTVISSAVSLINGFGGMLSGLKQQLADALAVNDQQAMQQVVADMEHLKLDIDQQSSSLADAVAANTATEASASAGDNASATSESSFDGDASSSANAGSGAAINQEENEDAETANESVS